MSDLAQFTLIVDQGPEGYVVSAQGPAGLRVPPFPFQLQEDEVLAQELNRIAMGFAPSRERMQTVGERLFEALMPREIYGGYRSALGPTAQLGLRLVVRPAQLSHLPWELLYDASQHSFLVAQRSQPLARIIEHGQPSLPLVGQRPLRVLLVEANPAGTSPLDSQRHEAAVRQALGDNGSLTVIHDASPKALRQALRRDAFQVLHYHGHGAFDGQEGHLYLHDRAGDEEKIYKLGGELLKTFLGGTSVRLAVLTGCETAATARNKRLAGLAQQLALLPTLPAVVAMQFEIPELSALAFTTGFYNALADGDPVDLAMSEGRKAILESMGGDPFGAPDWATPVLFLRLSGGELLAGPDDLSSEANEMGSEERSGGGDVSLNNLSGVTIGGDVRGGDQHIGGDQVGGDKITTAESGADPQSIAEAFAAIYQAVERSPINAAQQSVANQAVDNLEQEVGKGEEANEDTARQWLDVLLTVAPSVAEVAVNALINPGLAVSSAVRQVAEATRGRLAK